MTSPYKHLFGFSKKHSQDTPDQNTSDAGTNDSNHSQQSYYRTQPAPETKSICSQSTASSGCSVFSRQDVHSVDTAQSSIASSAGSSSKHKARFRGTETQRIEETDEWDSDVYAGPRDTVVTGKPLTLVNPQDYVNSSPAPQLQSKASDNALNCYSKRAYKTTLPAHMSTPLQMPIIPLNPLSPSSIPSHSSHRSAASSTVASNTDSTNAKPTDSSTCSTNAHPSGSTSKPTHHQPSPDNAHDPDHISLSEISQILHQLATEIKSIFHRFLLRQADLHETTLLVNESIHVVAKGQAICNYQELVRKNLRQRDSSGDDHTRPIPSEKITRENPSIARILKVCCHISDNLLRDTCHLQIKQSLLFLLHDLGVKLGLVQPNISTAPRAFLNYAVDTDAEHSSQVRMVRDILDLVTRADSSIVADQEGAFVAPITRGLSRDFAITALCFGLPKLTQAHTATIEQLYDISPLLHVYCLRNQIRTCALKAPFRIPTDPTSIPMSMSISSLKAQRLSGTLGGYIYPKIRPGDPHYEEFGNSTFALTCGHVCYAAPSFSSPNPAPHNLASSSSGEIAASLPVSTPSSVLVSLYKHALRRQRDRFIPGSEEHNTYNAGMEQANRILRQCNGANGSGSLGKVMWGERCIVNGSVSDVAVIRCNEDLKCHNFLGDDVAFSEFDPTLMFGNLYVRRIIGKVVSGSRVFKYGSFTKYTAGAVNGAKMVYWADGKLHSSEFVVGSENTGPFASGGDSGAWILQTSRDTRSTSSDSESFYQDAYQFPESSASTSSATATAANESDRSLAVIGMLHSYDGERKEFGLFTPMTTILERLFDVTGIRWGVVGVPDDEEQTYSAEGSDSGHGEDLLTASSSEGDN